MDRMNLNQKETLRGGNFFLFLAFLLLVLTVIGFFQTLSPKKALMKAIEKTKEEVFYGDDVFFLISDAFCNGSISVSGEGEKIEHLASLPEGAYLSLEDGKGKTEFSFSQNRLAMSHPLSEISYASTLSGASDALPDSAFSDAEIPKELLFLFRNYLALLETGSVSQGILSETGRNLWDAASFDLRVQNGKSDDSKGKEYVYEASSEGILLFLAEWSKQGEKEEVKEAISSLLSLTYSLSDEKVDSEKKEAALSFLTGKGEVFENFCKKISGENSKLSISFFVSSGRVRTAEFSLAGGDFLAKGEIRLGKKVKKDGEIQISFSAKEEEKEIFSFQMQHKIQEDSDSALIRDWYWKICDSEKRFFSQKEEAFGEITFSWGKKKGDLGVRFLTDEKKINLRGGEGDYKKGKELSFVLKRIELDGNNILSSPFQVRFSQSGNLPAFSDGESELFCQGQEREKLASDLKKLFPEKFR